MNRNEQKLKQCNSNVPKTDIENITSLLTLDKTVTLEQGEY